MSVFFLGGGGGLLLKRGDNVLTNVHFEYIEMQGTREKSSIYPNFNTKVTKSMYFEFNRP